MSRLVRVGGCRGPVTGAYEVVVTDVATGERFSGAVILYTIQFDSGEVQSQSLTEKGIVGTDVNGVAVIPSVERPQGSFYQMTLKVTEGMHKQVDMTVKRASGRISIPMQRIE